MNTVKGSGSLVIGSNSECNHKNCILIGDRLKSDYDYQLKIGSNEFSNTKRMDDVEFNTLRFLINSMCNGF